MWWDKIVKAICAIGGAIAGLFGEWNGMLTLLAIMMLADYISGLLAAVVGRSDKTENGRISSAAGFIGLAKKGLIMLIVLVATLLDKTMGNTTMVFQTAVTCYYIANEGISIMENADKLGVPYPKKLKEAFESMRKNNDKDSDKKDDTGQEGVE